MNNTYTFAMRKGADELLNELVDLGKKREKADDIFYGRIGEKYDKMKKEGAEPDTYGCECMFLYSFVTEQMRKDFSFIAREFLLNCFGSMDFKKGIVPYIKRGSGERSVKMMIRFHVLNLMWNAVKQGNEYAKNLFLYLFKTYYSKEYKQLKRFRTISVKELNAIALKDPDDKDAFSVARVYTMSQLMGISIDNDLDKCLKYAALSEYYEAWEAGVADKRPKDIGNFSEEDVKELVEDVSYDCEEISERYHIADKDAMKYLKKVQKFIDHIRDNDCGKAAGDIYNLPDISDLNFFLGNTLHDLKEVFGEGEYTDKEIMLFWALDNVVSAANFNGKCGNMMIEEILLGKVVDLDEHGPELELFNAEEAKKGVFHMSQTENPTARKEQKKEEKVQNSEDKESALNREIEDLRRQLHLQENEIKGLKSELSEMRSVREDKEKLATENRNMRTELAALRNHVYNLTENESENDTVSTDEMKSAIKDKRIVIIGGDVNWINKMKNNFPDWVYVKPSNSGTMDTKIVEKADKVYFFTDTIDHGTYYRYCGVVRDCGTPFGYIHGVNIGNITRQLYKELIADND